MFWVAVVSAGAAVVSAAVAVWQARQAKQHADKLLPVKLDEAISLRLQARGIGDLVKATEVGAEATVASVETAREAVNGALLLISRTETRDSHLFM